MAFSYPNDDDPEVAALLAACKENPDSFDPALQLADRYQELGDEKRAEFMRLRCRIEQELSSLFDLRPSQIPYQVRDFRYLNEVPQEGRDYSIPRWRRIDTLGWWDTIDPIVRMCAEADTLVSEFLYRWIFLPCPSCAGERFPGYFGSDSLADAFYADTEQRRCITCIGTGTMIHLRQVCEHCLVPMIGASLRCRRCHKPVDTQYEHHSEEDYDGTWFCANYGGCPVCDGRGEFRLTWRRGIPSYNYSQMPIDPRCNRPLIVTRDGIIETRS